MLLESFGGARNDRYSIVAVKPFLVFRPPAGHDPFRALKSLFKRRASSAIKARHQDVGGSVRDVWRTSADVPFAGGAIGFIGYEAARFLEPRVGARPKPGPDLPDAYFLFFDEGIVFDHEKRGAFIFAGGKKRLPRLEGELRRCLEEGGPRGKSPFAPPAEGSIRSSLSRRAFVGRVRRTKRYIRKGDIYQANLAQRFDFSFRGDPAEIYARLRRINPSPFFGLVDGGDFQIVSGSPERLVKIRRGFVQTRPIAGTRSRGRNSQEDSALSRELIASEKERAEHLMLVDLERNDLGRVCRYGSVRVDELMGIEQYSHVKHIVSNVRGRLKPGLDAVDVLAAMFPGGTVTGVPKIRCMQVIRELEPVARGPYTGSLGYIGFNGDMDFNILIRSLVVKRRRGWLHVGAGIVADSIPEKEYDETLYKAAALFSALFGEENARRFLRSRGVAV